MCSCSLLDHLMLTLFAFFVAPVFPPHVWSFTMFASLYFSLISTKLVFILSWVFLSVLFKKKNFWLLNKVPFWGCVGILKKAHTQLRIFFSFYLQVMYHIVEFVKAPETYSHSSSRCSGSTYEIWSILTWKTTWKHLIIQLATNSVIS